MAYSNVYMLARSETSNTFGISRLGEEERSESFPSPVTHQLGYAPFSFFFIVLALVCVGWVKYCFSICCSGVLFFF